MSNKKTPTAQPLKKRNDSNENKNILIPKKENNKMKHVLVANGNTSLGDGLWCITKNEDIPKSKPEEVEIKSLTSMNKIDKQTENSMLSFLENQLSELGVEIEIERAKNKNISLEKIQLKNSNEILTRKINEVLADLNNEKNTKKKVEEQMENIKELYNRTTRETSKLTNDLRQEQEKNKLLTENLNSSVNKNDQEFYHLKEEIRNLRQKNEELEEENEDFKNKLAEQDHFAKKTNEEKNKHLNEFKMQTVNQNEARLEKLARVIQENADLSDKLLESENLRRRFMEKCGYQEKELKKIYEEKKELETINNTMKKRISDLTVLKSSNNKILEEKILVLSQKLESLTKENASMKTKIKGKFAKATTFENDEKEILEEVEAKPYLFGPYDKNL